MSSGEVRLINGKRVATTEYRSWQMMKNRCLNPRAMDYAYYGGRGVLIAVEWGMFEGFLADMGRKPTPSHTLERKDGDGHYCKSNCVWATRQEQARNRDYVKFSMLLADTVRVLYATGLYRQVDIAALFGTTQAAISQITRNAAWRRNGDAQ